MRAASIFISLGGNTALFYSLAACLIILTLLFYRYTIPPLPFSKKVFLTVLRSVSLFIILLLIFEPILNFVTTKNIQPAVAVIIDDTQSIAVSEKFTHHNERLKEFLNSKGLLNSLSEIEIKYFTFSAGLVENKIFSYDSLAFNGEVTDISTSLTNFSDIIKNENYQAALFISDGNYNTGKNPIYEVENLRIPIYTLGLGDTTEQKDVAIDKIQTNYLVYSETRVPVDVSVRSSGYNNESAEVTLGEGQNIVDRKTIKLPEGAGELCVKLYYGAKQEGIHRLTAAISKIPGELTDKNNYKTFFVKVLKTKMQILLFAGGPSPDVAVVNQILTEDGNMRVTRCIQRNQDEFYENRFTPALLDSADCILLIGFPNSTTSNYVLKQIQTIIEQKRKPIFFLGAKNLDLEKLQMLEPYLPFTSSLQNPSEVNVFASIPEKMQKNPLVFFDETSSNEAWLRLPPIYKMGTQFKSKPESDIIADVKTQNIILNEPLIAARNIGRQKSIAVTGYGIWRWRLLVQDSPQTEKLLSLFIINAVRWLTSKDEDKKINVVPSKETFSTGEVVEFTGQVYDDEYRQVDGAEVKLELIQGAQKTEVVLSGIGNGRYEGGFSGFAEGDYEYTAKVLSNGVSLGEDKGKFSIGKMNIEFLDTKMNKQLLEQIADKTGGEYASIENSGNIISTIRKHKFSSLEVTTTKEIELWNWEYLAGFLIIVLALEWFIRKRGGLV
jgi:hypothetical protein